MCALLAPGFSHFLGWPMACPFSSWWLILSCLLGSFPLQTSDAVVKVDVVSVGAVPGPYLGQENRSLIPVPGQKVANFMDLAILP